MATYHRGMVEGVLLISLVASAIMTGIIVFVHWVHYPGFALIAPETFPEYHRRHSTATTWIVMPVMLVEAATGLLLLWMLPLGAANVAQGLLVLAVWLSTFCVQVPQHQRLSAGHDARTIGQLVRWNLLRVGLWPARTLLVAWMILR
jgi:hypothetical protein